MVALLELVSIAHVNVTRVNHVTQDLINELYVILYNDVIYI